MKNILLSGLATLMACTLLAPAVMAGSTVYESNDVLTPTQALGRFQWLEKCYDGLLLEVADQIFDPTNLIPSDEKISQLKAVFLYENGVLRADAKYLTFGDQNNENPKNWYAGTSISESCKQIPSDYSVSGLLVSLKLAQYCSAVSRDKEYEYIKSVKIAEIENESDARFYSNFMGQAIKIYKGTDYTLELTPGFTNGESYPESWHVFVDWNRDGDFDDTQESAYVGTSEGVIAYTLQPAVETVPGLTKMRITMDYLGGASSACKDISSGEVEDYLLYIK